MRSIAVEGLRILLPEGFARLFPPPGAFPQDRYIGQFFTPFESLIPWSLVVKTSPSKAGDVCSFPGQGAKNPTCLVAKKAKDKTETIL